MPRRKIFEQLPHGPMSEEDLKNFHDLVFGDHDKNTDEIIARVGDQEPFGGSQRLTTAELFDSDPSGVIRFTIDHAAGNEGQGAPTPPVAEA